MLRHQEYLDRRERRMVITYHDNMFVPPDQEDIQLLALQQALRLWKFCVIYALKNLRILKTEYEERITILIAAIQLQTATIRRQFLFSGCVYF